MSGADDCILGGGCSKIERAKNHILFVCSSFFFLQISKVSQLLGRSWEVVEAELKFNVAFSLLSRTSCEQ